MHSSALSTPARRRAAAVPAAAALAAVLAFAPAAHASAPAPAAGASGGTAGAAVLRTALDVALLHGTVDVPLDVTLDDVHAPGDARETAVSARLGGFDGGHPFEVLRADVATARATADAHTASGHADLVNAVVALPGLPGPLLTVEQATSTATCAAGHHPAATSDVLGTVRVLGRPVTLRAGGSTGVRVAGVGSVRLALSQTATTSTTAAATALHLTVAVDPLGLSVATVKGDVTLVRATCATPAHHGGGGGGTGGSSGGSSGGTGSGGGTGGTGGTGGSGAGSNGGAAGGSSGTGGASGGSHGGTSAGGASGAPATGGGSSGGPTGSSGTGSSGTGSSGGHPQTVTTTGRDLAETGAGSSTPLVAGVAIALLVAGGTVFVVARRRGAAARG